MRPPGPLPQLEGPRQPRRASHQHPPRAQRPQVAARQARLRGDGASEGSEQLLWVEHLRHLRPEKWLSRGASGSVLRVRDRATTTKFAMKVAETTSMGRGEPERVASLLREARALRRLRHPNVVRLREAVRTDGLVLLLLDDAGPQNLLQCQKLQEGEVMGPMVAHGMFQQVVGALHHCHSQGIAHRNINQQHVVLRSNPPTVVLISFGKASGIGTPCEHVGTVQFMAPEVMALMSEDFDVFKADVWSIGILLLEMLCGLGFLARLLGWSEEAKPCDFALPCSLWDFLCSPQRLTIAMRGKLSVSEALDILMHGLLCTDVRHRWTAAMAGASSWLQERSLDAL